MPRHQVITIKKEEPKTAMGCRFKNLIYLSCVLLVGLGAWYSYFKPGQQLSDPWPWTDEAVESSRDLLTHDDDDGDDQYLFDDDDRDFDDDDDDDDNGFGVNFSRSDFLETKLDESNSDPSELQHDKGTSSEHQDNEYHIPYNEELIDLQNEIIPYENEDQESSLNISYNAINPAPLGQVEIEDNKTNVPQITDLNFDATGNNLNQLDNDLNLPIGIPDEPSKTPSEIPLFEESPKSTYENVELPVVNAANQILQNHAEKAEQLGIIPSDKEIGIENEDVATEGKQAEFEVVEKHKPRIVLRSAESRQTRDANADVPKIPRIIHQSWDTSDIPVSFVPWVQSWLRNNANWEYWFWTNEDVKTLIQKSYPSFAATFESRTLSVMDRANMMRYFIIHAHGGLYAELDMECLKGMDSWIFSHSCFLVEEAREHSYLVNNQLGGNVINALMACKPHHPFYEVIMRALPDYLIRYSADPEHASGSFFLDDIYRAFQKHPMPSSLANFGEVSLIEPDYFIPSYDEKHWQSIDKACNSNIANMPFHVSWLCTLWLRKRMHANEPYKHSYTDHHWVDLSELGAGNVGTVSILAVIRGVIPNSEVQNPTPNNLYSDSQYPGVPQELQPASSQVPYNPTDAALAPQQVPEQLSQQIVPQHEAGMLAQQAAVQPEQQQAPQQQLPQIPGQIPLPVQPSESILQHNSEQPLQISSQLLNQPQFQEHNFGEPSQISSQLLNQPQFQEHNFGEPSQISSQLLNQPQFQEQQFPIQSPNQNVIPIMPQQGFQQPLEQAQPFVPHNVPVIPQLPQHGELSENDNEQLLPNSQVENTNFNPPVYNAMPLLTDIIGKKPENNQDVQTVPDNSQIYQKYDSKYGMPMLPLPNIPSNQQADNYYPTSVNDGGRGNSDSSDFGVKTVADSANQGFSDRINNGQYSAGNILQNAINNAQYSEQSANLHNVLQQAAEYSEPVNTLKDTGDTAHIQTSQFAPQQNKQYAQGY